MPNLTSGDATMINRMNEAAKRTSLGTAVKTLQDNADALSAIALAIRADIGDAGTHTVTTTEVANSVATISSALTSTISGFIVQIYRSNILQTGADIEAAGTAFTVKTNGTTYVLSTGDVVKWLVL